jgi:hypothetical protein
MRSLKSCVSITGGLGQHRTKAVSRTWYFLSRVAFAIFGVLAALSTALAFNPAPEPARTRLHVRLKLMEGEPGNLEKSKVLAEPAIEFEEMEKFWAHTGGRHAPLPFLPATEPLQWGWFVEGVAGRLSDGKVPLDVSIRIISYRRDPVAERLEFRSSGHRVIQFVKLDESVTVPVPTEQDAKQQWLMLKLTEVPKKYATTTTAPDDNNGLTCKH